MAEYNIKIMNKHKNGTSDILYPITKAKNVNISPSNNIPSTASNVDSVLNSLGDIAFKNQTDTSLLATANLAGLMSPSDKNKLDGIASGANKYTHPITSGNKHIPSGGSEGKILRWGSDGTAVWGDDNNTTYSNATTTTSGLMSATDKSKLDGISTGANAYTHPSTSGNKHIPSGGSSGKILRWASDGTAVWGDDNNTTYSNATTTKAGLMSASDKSKIDGIKNVSTMVYISGTPDDEDTSYDV